MKDKGKNGNPEGSKDEPRKDYTYQRRKAEKEEEIDMAGWTTLGQERKGLWVLLNRTHVTIGHSLQSQTLFSVEIPRRA